MMVQMVPLLWWCLAVATCAQVEENSGDDRPYITPSPPKVTGATHRRVLLNKGFEYTNPDFVDGKPLYQKDILLNPEQWQALRERKALASAVYRWPEVNGFPLVPYITVSPVNVTAVQAGLQHWMANTCIKFTLTTNTKQPHLRFIQGSGCYSYLGRQVVNGQDVSIGVGCERVGIVAHEVGHAIGFVHEQSRPDRDTYVKINFQNVIPQRVHNFNKFSTAQINNYSVPYDYSSDMHYGSSFFTNNGKLTVSTVDMFAQGIIGLQIGLSHRDKQLANLMYNCIDKWLKACKVAKDPCKKGGYFGANCKCVCPPGTTGPLCQTVTGGYYDALRQPCSRTITTPGVITSPNYPNNYPAGSRCVYVIQAPKCTFARLTFKSFRLYQRTLHCDSSPCCYIDFLEIRNTNTVSDRVYCDKDIVPGQVFTSSVNPLILFFYTISNHYSGWSATVSFVPRAGCT
ncbi:protein SpAN-like [Procambarus clarkii]|uniref:protein SpAN-like n=1 Tax=Procambarus clarkii TaxID=6728 RepID=UPI00374294A4